MAVTEIADSRTPYRQWAARVAHRGPGRSSCARAPRGGGGPKCGDDASTTVSHLWPVEVVRVQQLLEHAVLQQHAGAGLGIRLAHRGERNEPGRTLRVAVLFQLRRDHGPQSLVHARTARALDVRTPTLDVRHVSSIARTCVG